MNRVTFSTRFNSKTYDSYDHVLEDECTFGDPTKTKTQFWEQEPILMD